MGAGLGGLVSSSGNAFVDGAIRGAVGSSLTQGIAVATGLQQSFSWRSVAASAVGAGVGAAVGDALGGNYLPADQAGPVRPEAFSGLGGFGSAVARGTVSGFAAGLATSALRGGKISVTQVATDAFGNALGDSIAAANGQQSDPQGDFISQNQQSWDTRTAAYDQVVGAFSQHGGNQYAGVQLAAGPGYSGMGSGSSERDQNIDRMPNLATSSESSSRYVSTGDPNTYITDDGRIGILVSGVGDDGRSFIDEVRSGTEGPVTMNEGRALGTPLPLLGNLPSPYGPQASIGPQQSYWDDLRGIAGSDLSFGDKLDMGWGATNYAFRGSDTAQGLVQVAGGGLEVAGSLALDWTGPGALIGVPLGIHGADSIGAGVTRIMDVGDGSTLTYQGTYALTGSSTFASAVDQGIPFLGAVGLTGATMRSAWTITSGDMAAGLRYEASQAAVDVTPTLRSIADANGGEMRGL